MKRNSYAVLQFLKEHDGEQITTSILASALDLENKQITGIVNGLARHKDADKNPEPYAERLDEKIDIEVEDGKIKQEKLIVITDAGKAFDGPVED